MKYRIRISEGLLMSWVIVQRKERFLWRDVTALCDNDFHGDLVLVIDEALLLIKRLKGAES